MISVVIPAFREERRIAACLESLAAQTDPDFEAIVVDDGSPDGTADAADAFASRDARFRVFRRDHRGILPTLRFAVEQARGEFLSRLDADDLVPPRRHEVLRDLLLESGDGCVATGGVEVTGTEGRDPGPGFLRYAEWMNGLRTHEDCLRDAFVECVIPSPGWLMRRADFDRAGGLDGVLVPEDYDLALRWIGAGIRIVKTPETILVWRDHPDRTSRTSQDYADVRFAPTKARHFGRLLAGARRGRETVIWGAGDRAKHYAKALESAGHPVAFLVTENPRKIGQDWQGKAMADPGRLDRERHFVVSCVAAKGEDSPVRRNLTASFGREGKDWIRFS